MIFSFFLIHPPLSLVYCNTLLSMPLLEIICSYFTTRQSTLHVFSSIFIWLSFGNLPLAPFSLSSHRVSCSILPSSPFLIPLNSHLQSAEQNRREAHNYSLHISERTSGQSPHCSAILLHSPTKLAFSLMLKTNSHLLSHAQISIISLPLSRFVLITSPHISLRNMSKKRWGGEWRSPHTKTLSNFKHQICQTPPGAADPASFLPSANS